MGIAHARNCRGHAESPWIGDACNGGCEARAYVIAPRSWSRQPIEATMYELDGRDPRSGLVRSRIGTWMEPSWIVSVRLFGSKQSYSWQSLGRARALPQPAPTGLGKSESFHFRRLRIDREVEVRDRMLACSKDQANARLVDRPTPPGRWASADEVFLALRYSLLPPRVDSPNASPRM